MALRELNPGAVARVDLSFSLSGERGGALAPWGSRLAQLLRGSFPGCGRCRCAIAAWRREVSQTAPATTLVNQRHAVVNITGLTAATYKRFLELLESEWVVQMAFLLLGPMFQWLLAVHRRVVENRWRDFFSNPSQWWDNRPEKENDRYPDFTHKWNRQALWLNGKLNPPWVAAELAAMLPGAVHWDLITWNKRLARYFRDGQHEKVVKAFRQLQQEGITLNSYTFIPVLKACASLRALREGRSIHKQIIESRCEMHVHVSSCLVDMYAKCGQVEDAWRVFNKLQTHDVVTWSAMILGYVKCGQGQRALELLQQMHEEGVEPNNVTFVGELSACASLGDLEEGRRIHGQIIQSGWESDISVGSSLVDMYAKCGDIDEARRVFEKMPTRNVVAWTAMILGCVKCGQGEKALELSWQMQWEGVEPNPVTFVGVLNACASVGALDEGKLVHAQIIEQGFESNAFVGNSLIDMYAKCGSLEDALRIFNKMSTRSVVSWSSMLGGYAMHGRSEEALEHFEQMCREGVEINEVTFVSLLSACSHARLVDEGLHYFQLMTAVYRISPSKYHYACMFDLLGRAGRLDEAEDLIKTSAEPNQDAWISFLSACRVHGNDQMRLRIAEWLQKSGPGLLSDRSVDTGNWDRGKNIQEQRPECGAKKDPARSWIEVNSEVHSFTINDQNHPQIIKVRSELKRLSRKMEEAGYLQDIELASHDADEEEKPSQLCTHSERMAIAFGLISTPPRTPLRIFKNLRLCRDCHTAAKFISKLAERAIIMRDVNRFHHFEDGVCSCMDFW